MKVWAGIPPGSVPDVDQRYEIVWGRGRGRGS